MKRRRSSRGEMCVARGGFSLVEAVVAVLIVGGMFVAAMSALSVTHKSRVVLEDRARGLLLAEDLMAEVLQRAYTDPATGEATFGSEVDEQQRSDYDDVDDYHGWSAEPPEDADGTPLDGADAYARAVEVQYVLPDNVDQGTAAPSGVKRITVTVSRDGRRVAVLDALRTEAWADPVGSQEVPE